MRDRTEVGRESGAPASTRPGIPTERGRAGAGALVLALLLGAAALAPALTLRAALPSPAETDPAVARDAARREDLLARGRRAAERLAARAVHAGLPRERRFGPPPPAPEVPPPRVTALDGTVAEGRLRARWVPAPGSRATIVRVEGLGGPGVLERTVDAGVDALEVAVPAVEGTIVVHATPVADSGTAPTDRVSIPFRIPVEILRVDAASLAAGNAVVVLRRAFDGRPVEARFPVAESETLGGLSTVTPGDHAVDFLTDYVLEAVRARRIEEPRTYVVPRFQPDGRVRRDAAGNPDTVERRDTPRITEVPEVVLRGPGEERRILRVSPLDREPR